MADFELIQQRRISGKGLIRIPSDTRKNRLLVLYADVFRRPKNESLNFNYSPPRSRYATITFHRNDYVIETKSIDYLRQSFDGISDITGQTLIAVKCAYEGILDTFVNLSVALASTPGGVGLAPISYTDLIKDYEYLNLSWDEARVVCFADTAIQFRLYRLIHDTCDPDKDKDKRPPSPPPPPASVPPGTPVTDLDPPYSDEDDPDDFTSPYPDDEYPIEPPGTQCQRYRVIVRVFSTFSPPPPYRDIELFVYGQVGEPYIAVSGGARSAVISAYGQFAPTDTGCLSSPANITVAAGLNSYDPPPELILFEEA